jgi:hypothetical protein
MKKLLLILLCLPMIGFGQVKDNKSTFNFNKSNNYNKNYSNLITKRYYNNDLKFNFNKAVKNHNNTISSCSFYSNNKSNYSPFNKGLIHLLSEAMQQGKNNNPSILKKNTN